MWSKALMKNMLDQSPAGWSDGELSLEGDGDGWGYSLGVIFIPYDKLRFGLSYRSGIEVDYDADVALNNIAPALQPLFGGATYSTNAGTAIEFPAVLDIGTAYMPTDYFTVELDFEWTGWSSYDRLDVDLQNEVAFAGFTDSSEVKDWDDVWALKLGVEYTVNRNLCLRAGYTYDNNPIPGHTLEPRLPDSDQQNLSVGFGYKWDNINIDGAYMAAYYKDRTAGNSIISGDYENFVHYFALSMGFGF
jgi:long-chain fatty acid transport protein